MTGSIQWKWRALWALAACTWLAVLPAMAADADAMVHDAWAQAGDAARAVRSFPDGGKARRPDRICDSRQRPAV